MTNRIDDINKKIEKLNAENDKKIERLKAQKRLLQNKENAKARKIRNHTLMVLGGMFESIIGDCRSIDLDGLEKYLNQYQFAIKKYANNEKNPKDITYQELNEYVRNWEKQRREKKKQERQGAQQSPPINRVEQSEHESVVTNSRVVVKPYRL